MGLDIYAAKQDEDGTWGPVMGFNHADWGRHTEEDFVHNPMYVPGVAISMSGGNWIALMRHVLKLEGNIEDHSMEDIRTKAYEALERGQNRYHTCRLVELVNICELGIARGADHIIAV